jgi:Fur family ferric uptake transcriptional regulator
MKKDIRQSAMASELAGKGIRLTRQRKVLLEIIENASDHLHASDLLRLAREHDQSIDRATVYRTLAMLKEHGLVEELDLLHLDGSEHHYELKGSRGHIHICCKKCGRVVEYDTELVTRLEDEVRERTGFDVDSSRIEIAAVCPVCLDQA